MKVYCHIYVLLQFVKICLISCFDFLSMSVAFNLTTSMYFLLFCIQFVSLSNSNRCRMFSSNLFLPFIILCMKLILPFIILFFISDDPISLRRVEFGAYCGAFSIVLYTLFSIFCRSSMSSSDKLITFTPYDIDGKAILFQ